MLAKHTSSLHPPIAIMSLPRFYIPTIPTAGPVNLSPEDARHAQSVLRLKVGDVVQLFDGCGFEAQGQIAALARSSVQIEVANVAAVSRELRNKLELVMALPKGDRQKQLIDVLVQLGVDQLTPLECERSVAQPTDNAIERLQRSVIESCKQCGRNQLMRVSQPVDLAQLTAGSALVPSSTQAANKLHLFAHPYGPCSSLINQLSSLSQGPVHGRVVVGPEGGLTDGECLRLSQASWIQIELGKRILRIETAAIMIAAAWATLDVESSAD